MSRNYKTNQRNNKRAFRLFFYTTKQNWRIKYNHCIYTYLSIFELNTILHFKINYFSIIILSIYLFCVGAFMTDLSKVWVVEISYGNEEKETLHLISEAEPSTEQINKLLTPYIKKVWHESGNFEIDDFYTVQQSIDRLLSFSQQSSFKQLQ